MNKNELELASALNRGIIFRKQDLAVFVGSKDSGLRVLDSFSTALKRRVAEVAVKLAKKEIRRLEAEFEAL